MTNFDLNRIRELNDEEIAELYKAVKEEFEKRETKKREKFYFLEISEHKYKGKGKAWVAWVNELGRIIEFVEPYSVVHTGKHSRLKRYFLSPGKYFVQEEGSWRRDSKYYLTVKEEDCTEVIPD